MQCSMYLKHYLQMCSKLYYYPFDFTHILLEILQMAVSAFRGNMLTQLCGNSVQKNLKGGIMIVNFKIKINCPDTLS